MSQRQIITDLLGIQGWVVEADGIELRGERGGGGEDSPGEWERVSV